MCKIILSHNYALSLSDTNDKYVDKEIDEYIYI